MTDDDVAVGSRRWFDADSGLDCLKDIRAFVREAAAAAEAGAETTADLVQAVDECATNVIEHGYRGPGRIEVEIALTDGSLVVHLRDAAPAFDPTAVPEPDLDLPLERRPLGGMGVHLARDLTDGMQHRILPGGGNELTLVKRLRREGGR